MRGHKLWQAIASLENFFWGPRSHISGSKKHQLRMMCYNHGLVSDFFYTPPCSHVFQGVGPHVIRPLLIKNLNICHQLPIDAPPKYCFFGGMEGLYMKGQGGEGRGNRIGWKGVEKFASSTNVIFLDPSLIVFLEYEILHVYSWVMGVEWQCSTFKANDWLYISRVCCTLCIAADYYFLLSLSKFL